MPYLLLDIANVIYKHKINIFNYITQIQKIKQVWMTEYAIDMKRHYKTISHSDTGQDDNF